MTIPRMERQNDTTRFPLSASQEQLWYFNQLAPGSPVYNVVDLVDLGETYDSQTLRKVAGELVRRHETLRTAFSAVGGRATQVVLPSAEVELMEVDLSSLPEAEQKSEWAKVVSEQTQKAFDLSQAPLIRWTAIHRSATDHKLLVVIHHIITDEWGTGILHNEITQLYGEFSRGESSSLPELPIQFADFACWQKNSLKEAAIEKHLAYWKNELAGAPRVLELPTDKPRPAMQSFRGAWECLHVPSEVIDPLKTLTRQERATFFMVLLSGFMALLYRYTGQDDILVGTAMSLRRQSETEKLVGYFLNTIVLRAQFTEGLSFRELLQQVRKRTFGAFTHAELPFNRLVAEMAPERDPSRTPLFQVAFNVHDPDGVSEVSNGSDRGQLGTGTSKVDLTLDLSESQGGLDVSIEYSTDLFDRSTIQRICKHFGTLLESVGSNPDATVATLALLTEADRNETLYGWNETALEYPKNVPLAQLVEQQVERTPNAMAVVHGEQKLSFRELNARANQLAHELRKLGAGPDQLVGVFVERSTDLVVSLLAIVKTGAAYLPLDPLFPADRLGYMLEDSGARMLVTQQSLRKDMPPYGGSVLVLEDKGWQANPKHNVEVAVGPDNLAYLLYTSGSTGKPKGVQIPRSALTNFLWSMRASLALNENDRLLAVTTISFDIAGLEIWLPLLVGSQLVMASREQATDGTALRGLFDKHGITFMQATPVTWRLLFESGWKGKPDMQAVCGGEAMPPEVALQLAPAVKRVWNLYGPTETTIWSTEFVVADGRQPILIGRPIANTQCYILDAHLEPVPVGVTGELYIGGDGLAVGYLHRPELTAEKFVDDPFRKDQPSGGSAKMYRTGDLARYKADGNIECLGRVDHQVKIRGYRIELGEIEAVLKSLPGVKQAVVIVREDTPGDKRLVAYYIPEQAGAEAIGAEQFRAHLSSSLPEYMIPVAYVRMLRMPLTPNGKLDRKALPAPESDAFQTREYEAPMGEIEAELARVWAEVLKLDRVGRNDNFFDLGGHSLLAVQLMLKLQEIIPGEPLPLRAVLEAPTVERFAAWLVNRGEDKAQILVRMRTGSPSRLPFFCVHGAGGNVLSLRALSMAMPADLPVYVLQAKGLDGSKPFETVEESAQFYVDEIRKVQPHGPYQLAGMSYGSLVAFEMARVLEQAKEPVGSLFLIDCMNPGFAKYLPKTELASRFIKFGLTRLSWHLRTMASLKPSEWFGYVRNPFIAMSKYVRSLVAGKANLEDQGLRADADWEKIQTVSGTRLGDILERVGRASRVAGSTFVPGHYNGTAVVVRSSEPWPTPYQDDFLGWKPVVHGGIENIEVSGDHESMFEDPDVKEVADVIDVRLRQAATKKIEAA